MKNMFTRALLRECWAPSENTSLKWFNYIIGEIRDPRSGTALSKRVAQIVIPGQRCTFTFEALRPEGIPNSAAWSFTGRCDTQAVSARGQLDRDGRQVRIGPANLR